LQRPEACGTEAELRRATAEGRKLQMKHNAALTQMREAAQQRDETQARWFAAAQAYKKAAFDERLRLIADVPTPDRGVSELSAVE
jgi:hypothetical protein